MTEVEFFNDGLHNKHIEFVFTGKKMSGVIMDTIPLKEKQNRTIYHYIKSKNLREWKDVQERNDKTKMKELCSVIDISQITLGKRL